MADQNLQPSDHYGVAHIASLASEGILGRERSPTSAFNAIVAERLLFPYLCLGPIIGIDLNLVTSIESTESRVGIIRKLSKAGIIKDQESLRLDVSRKYDKRKVSEHNSSLLVFDRIRVASWTELLISNRNVNSLSISDQEWHKQYFDCVEKIGLEPNQGAEFPNRREFSRLYKRTGFYELGGNAQSKIEDLEVKWLMYRLSLSNIATTATHPFLESSERTSNALVEVLIDKVPLPDYRNIMAAIDVVGDPSFRRQHANLKRWANKLVDERLPYAEKRDLVLDGLEDIKKEVIKARIGLIFGVCKILISATAGVAEDIAKLRVESLANRPFDMASKVIELYESKRKLKDQPLYLAWKLTELAN